MLPVLKYTVLRLALFVAALGIFIAFRVSGIIALIGAAAVSFALSYVFLYRQRQEVADTLARRVEGRLAARGPSGSAQDAAVEDAADDARRGEGS